MGAVWTWLGEALTNPVIVAAVSAVAALVAVPVSVIALVSAHRTSSRMVQIEEGRDKAAEKASGKASVHASLVPSGNGFYTLVVRNDGPGVARNLVLTLDGKPASSHRTAMDRPLPDTISEMHPRAENKFAVAVAFGSPAPRAIEISWDDKSEEPGVFKSHL